MEAIRGMIDRSVGNGRAVRNCQAERLAHQRTEAEIDRLRARLPAPEQDEQRPVA